VAMSRAVTLTIFSTSTNADCGSGFSAQQAWQAIDVCGNTSICTQTVAVADQGPPTIAAQPQDEVVPLGETPRLKVVPSGCGMVSYQWFFNQTNLLSGETDSTLVLTNITAGQAGTYRVAVSNPYGSITSAPIQISVVAPPVILTDPSSVIATNGNNISF